LKRALGTDAKGVEVTTQDVAADEVSKDLVVEGVASVDEDHLPSAEAKDGLFHLLLFVCRQAGDVYADGRDIHPFFVGEVSDTPVGVEAP
jgi:hypothetical protein